MSSWVIIWEGMSFNSKGVESGTYGDLATANNDCDKLNSNILSDKRYRVVLIDSNEHLLSVNHAFSWR